MGEFSFPMEKPGAKQSFATSQMKRKSENGKEVKLGEKDEPAKNSFWSKRTSAPNSAKQKEKSAAPDPNKYRKNLSIIKERATPEKQKVSQKEQERLKFYKIKFFKK